MYNKILAPLDGSQLAECVLSHLETIAKGCGVRNVVLIRIVEPFRLPADADGGVAVFSGDEIERIDKENMAAAGSYLAQIEKQANYGEANIQPVVIMGRPAENIAKYATDNDVDLIIISTHGRSGVSRWVLGSVADRVSRTACVPVLMVRAPGCIPNF